MTVKHRRHTCC